MTELINKDGLTEKEFLERYEPGDYERPSVTVDMLLFTVGNKKTANYRKLPEKELKILLIKRKDHPHIGQWAIPGGFVDVNEALSHAVYRELKEETNVENIYMEQLYTWGDDVHRDKRMRVISVSHMALVSEEGLNPVAGDDAEEIKWFTVQKQIIEDSSDENQTAYNLLLTSDDGITICYLVIDRYVKKGVTFVTETTVEHMTYISETELAFDHSNIINLAVDRLRNKVEYTPIAFNLLPEKFTLTELQQVYETILGKELLKPNFRRKIKDMIIETTIPRHLIKRAGHRPSKYFKFNEKYRG